MAQLHVQKKRGQLWWLWIIVLLIIIGVVYYFLVRNNMVPDPLGINRQTTSLIHANENMHVI
ncbi:MAG TPA: hypothetical protein VEV83_13215 [Parafilimonas sp.]|nr:hypothetical protein [Parafilimonas sp.]